MSNSFAPNFTDSLSSHSGRLQSALPLDFDPSDLPSAIASLPATSIHDDLLTLYSMIPDTLNQLLEDINVSDHLSSIADSFDALSDSWDDLICSTLPDVVEEFLNQPLVGHTAQDSITQYVTSASGATAESIQQLLSEGNNDSIGTATVTGLRPGLSQLSFDAAIGDIDHVDPSVDIDFYAVTLQAGDRLTIDIDTTGTGRLDTYLSIFNGYGSELAWNDDGLAPDETSSWDSYLEFTATTAGTYYVSVSDYFNYPYDPMVPFSAPGETATGDYTMHLQLSPYASESNDILTQALATGLSSSNPGSVTYRGAIGDNPAQRPGHDRDMFQVRLNAGDRLTVDLDAYTQGNWFDGYLRLFDADGNELAFSSDDAAPGESLSYDAYLSYTAIVTGNYFIALSGDGNTAYNPFFLSGGTSGSTGTYSLDITVGSNDNSTESNDTLPRAIPIDLSAANPGTVTLAGTIGDNPAVASDLDVDMFSVYLAEGDRLELDIDAHEFGGILDSGLRIFDAFGNEVAFSDDNAAPGEDFSYDPYLLFTAATAGNYYISISGYGNYAYNPFIAGSGTPGSTGDYAFNVSLLAPSTTPTNPSYSPTYGYGLVDAAAAVALATSTLPAANQPNLGGNLWGLDMINAPEAWSQGYTGEGIVVAVLDTGVDYSHSDLDGNIWTNTGEIAGNGIDDDSNGYIDDVYGWDFVSSDNTPNDVDGHGTHVAGTIAGENDGIGITGVAYNASIMAVRVIGDWLEQDEYEYLRDIADGIYYAVNNGADVINMSLGYDPSWYGGSLPAEADAIVAALQYAQSQGTVVVMAAGNDYGYSPGYPALYASDWGIAVGAVDSTNQIAYFSNYAGTSPLDYVVAPGVSMYSTYTGGGYELLSGTSMASPHVAGVAALVMQANPLLTASEVEDILIGSANPTGIAA